MTDIHPERATLQTVDTAVKGLEQQIAAEEQGIAPAGSADDSAFLVDMGIAAVTSGVVGPVVSLAASIWSDARTAGPVEETARQRSKFFGDIPAPANNVPVVNVLTGRPAPRDIMAPASGRQPAGAGAKALSWSGSGGESSRFLPQSSGTPGAEGRVSSQKRMQLGALRRIQGSPDADILLNTMIDGTDDARVIGGVKDLSSENQARIFKHTI